MRNFQNTVVEQRHLCRWLQGPVGSLFVAHFACCVQLYRLSCGCAGRSPRRLGMGVRVECALALVITVPDGRLCSTVMGRGLFSHVTMVVCMNAKSVLVDVFERSIRDCFR